MTTLRVGMRVRLVRPVNPDNYGRTGVIRVLGIHRRSINYSLGCNCFVDWDDGERDGVLYGTHTSQLEPILDPGAQPSEFRTLAELLESLEVEA